MAEVADTQYVTVTLDPVTCCSCGMAFGISHGWNQKRHRDHEAFYCPAGHRQYWLAETEEQRLKRRLEIEQAEVERLRAARDRKDRQLSAAKGRITKIKNRVASGVCPCCNRTFVSLGRHMATKHPDWKGQEVG